MQFRNEDTSLLRWFVVRVRPNCEWKAAASLEARGFHVLVPSRIRLTKRRPAKGVRIPLFPGYIFCRFDGRSLVPVLNCAGVLQILSKNGVAEPVETSEMVSIMKLMASGAAVHPWPAFQQGSRVRVSSGPLLGVEGVVVRDDAKAKLVISITILKRSVATEIDRVWVESSSEIETFQPDPDARIDPLFSAQVV